MTFHFFNSPIFNPIHTWGGGGGFLDPHLKILKNFRTDSSSWVSLPDFSSYKICFLKKRKSAKLYGGMLSWQRCFLDELYTPDEFFEDEEEEENDDDDNGESTLSLPSDSDGGEGGNSPDGGAGSSHAARRPRLKKRLVCGIDEALDPEKMPCPK